MTQGKGVDSRYVIARNGVTKQSFVLVGSEKAREIAAASFGWPRNDIEKRLAMTWGKWLAMT